MAAQYPFSGQINPSHFLILIAGQYKNPGVEYSISIGPLEQSTWGPSTLVLYAKLASELPAEQIMSLNNRM